MINDLEIVQWDYLLDPAFQLVNTAGKPLTNGWIEVYIHGTRDKYYCASDFNGTLHPFKIPLDSLGSNIVLASPANAYDVYVYNVYGSLVMSRYNVKPGSGSGSGVIPADASYGIFGTNELPMNNTSNTGFQFTAKDIGGDDITFHEITYPYGRIDCKEGVYFYSATIEVSNTSTSNESVKFQVLAGKNPNQSVYWLDFDNTYLHKQLYTICGIANFVNEDTFRINVSPYQLTNGVKASASQVAIHKLSTVVEGEGGGGGHAYGAGWGILINNYEISVDPSIIPTIQYVDASVSAVSSTLISTIESVSGNLQDQIDNITEQVQSDWNQTDDTEVDYIKNKPDLSVFATHDEVCAVSSVLQDEIDNIDLSEYVTHTELNSTVTAVSSVLENEIQIVSAAIPDVSDFVTHDEVSAVSSNLVEYVDNSVSAVSGNLTQYIDNSVNTASGNLVQYIDNSIGAVSGDIIEYVDNTVNNVSGVLESEIQIVSGAIPVVTGYATKDEVNTVSSTIINNLEVVSAAIQDTIESVSGILQNEIDNIPEQVNADWDAVSGKAEILNKPDLSVYATHDEVNNASGSIIQYIDDSIDVVINNVTAVSSVLNNKIDAVSAAVPDAQIQSDWNQSDNTKKDYIKNKPDLSHFITDDELVNAVTSVSAVLETDIQVVSGALDDLTAVVASASGIEYGQFYSTGITTTPATMSRVKGTIAVDNGRIQLKKGSSYHVTVRGRYNQTTATNTNTSVGYIEYVSNNTINVNVDKTLTDSQYFEISYDLFNLSNDVSYLVWFTGTDGGTVNDLWIEIHSLAGIGNGSGGGTGPGTEYTPGYGIQILNNVISVSGIAPQVNADWNAVSGVAEILNKPEEQALVAGDNIDIHVSGSNVIISSTAIGDITKAEVAEVSGTLQTEIEQVSASIPGAQIQSDWNQSDNTKKDYIKNKPDLSVYATNATVSSVSGILNTKIETVSAAMPDPQIQSDWTEDDNTRVDFIKNKPIEYDLIGGQNVSVTVSGTNVIIDSTASGDVTHADLEAVSGALETNIQIVSSAIPEEMSLVAGDNIEIQVSGASAIISSTASGDVSHAELVAVSGQLETEIQTVSGKAVNADWTAVSGAAEILHKPDEYNLIAGTNVVITKDGNNVTISARGGGGGGGSSYIAGTGIDIDANDVISVSGVAMASAIDVVSAAIDVVSGKLPTTEIGKFTIQNNVTGGPIEVIIPTDESPLVATYQINSVSGTPYYSGITSGVINWYYGETPANFEVGNYYVMLNVSEDISNISAIDFYYSSSSTGIGGPRLSTASIVCNGTLTTGLHYVKAQYNQAGTSSDYGKYLQIMVKFQQYALDYATMTQWMQQIESKITLCAIGSPDSSLGTVVNLDRYYLGNTNTTTSNSGTQALVYTDPNTKKQTVLMPDYMPASWMASIIQSFEYGNSYVRPSNSEYTTNQYRAYKYTSSPRRYQFAYCTDWDHANKLMTFIAYDNSGNAIEKWTVDYTTYGSAVWTTTALDYATEAELQAVSGAIPEEINLIPGSGITIEVSGASTVISSTGGGGGSSYIAGNMIDITNNAISVETTAGITDIISVSALPANPVATVLYLIPES